MNMRSQSSLLLFMLSITGTSAPHLAGADFTEITSPILYDDSFQDTSRDDNPPPAANQVWTIPHGPWGDLEAYRLTVEPPDAFIDRTLENFGHQDGTVWTFSDKSPEEVRKALLFSGLESATAERLLAPPFLEESARGDVILHPPDDVIESMTRATRESLYPLLGSKSSPDPFSKPFSIYRDGFENMAADSGLSEEMIEKISGLTYFKFGSLFFSDTALVFKQAADETERRCILKVLCHQRSLVVRLCVSASSDLEAITDYWSASGKNRDILPILESVRQTDRVEKLDIVHLLPPTSRKFLNTYARPMVSAGQPAPDCFWTAFNFFAHEPSDRFHDQDIVNTMLPELYEKVTKPLQFGDLILIWNKTTGDTVHACNYIAGDIVFTKNGRSLNRPWVISRVQDVLSRYLVAEKVTISFFRRRQ